MTYLLIVYLYTGGASVVMLHDADTVTCLMRSYQEMRWDWRVHSVDCVPWQGGEA